MPHLCRYLSTQLKWQQESGPTPCIPAPTVRTWPRSFHHPGQLACGQLSLASLAVWLPGQGGPPACEQTMLVGARATKPACPILSKRERSRAVQAFRLQSRLRKFRAICPFSPFEFSPPPSSRTCTPLPSSTTSQTNLGTGAGKEKKKDAPTRSEGGRFRSRHWIQRQRKALPNQNSQSLLLTVIRSPRDVKLPVAGQLQSQPHLKLTGHSPSSR